jgi:lambda family phage tail tape measure protein
LLALAYGSPQAKAKLSTPAASVGAALPSGRTPKENQAIAERTEFERQARQVAEEWLSEEALITEEMSNQAEVVKNNLEPQKGMFEKLGEAIETHSTTFHSYLTNAADTWNRLGEVGASAVDGLSDALAQLATTGKANFKALALSILTELQRMIIKMLVAKAIMAALGMSPMPGAGGVPIGGTGGSVAPTVAVGEAMGDVFNAGRIIPFQKGGLINSVMPFALAGNNLGVAGERGPEMLAPVTRMPTGEMGVKAQPSQTVVNLKAVNVFDKSEIVGAMDSAEGERVLLNIMRRKGLI